MLVVDECLMDLSPLGGGYLHENRELTCCVCMEPCCGQLPDEWHTLVEDTGAM